MRIEAKDLVGVEMDSRSGGEHYVLYKGGAAQLGPGGAFGGSTASFRDRPRAMWAPLTAKLGKLVL